MKLLVLLCLAFLQVWACADPLEIQFSTLPPDCRIADLDSPQKPVATGGIVVKRPAAGTDLHFRLLKPGYYSLEVTIPSEAIPSGRSFTWPAKRESFLRLEPMLVSVMFATNPEGAEIWHSNSGRGDDYLGLTGQTLQLNLADLIGEKPDGFFRVRFSASGYQNVEIPIPEHLFGAGRVNRWPVEGTYALTSKGGFISWATFHFKSHPWSSGLALLASLALFFVLLETFKRTLMLVKKAKEIEQRTAAPEDDLLSGSRLGPYRLFDFLGQGGNSTVFRAGRDDDSSQSHPDVAIKVLNLGGDGPSRLAVEVQPLLGLRHPNIVQLVDWGYVDRLAYLVMELVTGRTLRRELDHGPLNLERWCLLADDLLSGLHHAHERGITHGDVKPENILVPWHGKTKLSDFGTARQALRPGLKKFGGTPGYMAPETIAQVDLNPLSDQFAAAVVLFEALLGEQPNIDQKAPVDLKTIEGVLTKMKSRDPAERFASIDLALERLYAVKGFVTRASGGRND